MSLDAWRERLETFQPRSLTVDGEAPPPLGEDVDIDATTVDEAARAGARRDGLWLVWSAETGPSSDIIGRTRQLRRAEVVVLSRVADRRAGAPFSAQDALDRLRARVDAALLGWIPPGAMTPVDFVRGAALAPGKDGAAWWADAYAADRLVSADGA